MNDSITILNDKKSMIIIFDSKECCKCGKPLLGMARKFNKKELNDFIIELQRREKEMER